MKGLLILLSPAVWSLKNDIVRFSGTFYKKAFFFVFSASLFIFLITKLLSTGMTRLQGMSQDVFSVLLIKGYSLIFMLIFLVQIINGLVLSLNTFYQSRDLDVLLTSPVNRTSLFFSKLFETHIKSSWMLVVFGIPLLLSAGLIYHADILYYFYALLLFAVFSIIPVNTGIALAMVIARFLNIRRLKRSLVSLGVVAAVLLVTLLRVFRPERFVTPELFANLTLFISEIKKPSFIVLPNRWLSDALFTYLGETGNIETPVFIALLFLTAYLTTVFLQMIFSKYYYTGWELMQEGDIRKRDKGPGASQMLLHSLIRRCTGVFRPESSALMQKDILYYIRDTRNIHQALITFSLIIIYLFSVAALPLNWEEYAVQLKYITSFFNLGLILIIIASVCSRFIYPAVASEAATLWLIRSCPMTSRRFIWTKFLFSLIPVLVLGQLLIIASSIFIGIDKAFILLMMVTTSLLSVSLVSMTIAFGISDVNRALKDFNQKQTGSAIYMIASVSLILLTLALEIIPAFLYFLKAATQAEFAGRGWLIIGATTALLFIANFLITGFSLRQSINRIDNLDLM